MKSFFLFLKIKKQPFLGFLQKKTRNYDSREFWQRLKCQKFFFFHAMMKHENLFLLYNITIKITYLKLCVNSVNNGLFMRLFLLCQIQLNGNLCSNILHTFQINFSVHKFYNLFCNPKTQASSCNV